MPYFLGTLAKILKINKKIKYKNKKLLGHYILSPYTFVPKKGKKFKTKSEIVFKEGIEKLVNEKQGNQKLW